VIDHYQAAVARMVFSNGDNSIGGGMHRGAIIRRHIDTGVKGALSAKRIEAFPKTVGNMAEHRPDGWRVAGIRKAHGRHQAQTTARNGDYRGIAFQKSVLLDGAVKRVLRSDRVVANIESRWMVAKHAVGHGNFGGQGLQGVQALVSVGDGVLQILILALEGLLIVAEGVVVANLPKHSRVGPGRGDDGDPANDG